MMKRGSSNKKVGLGQGLESLLGDGQSFADFRIYEEPHPDWKRVQGAKNIFSKLVQEFYEQRYPGCEVTFGDSGHENIYFCCNKAWDIYFRVQASGGGWPKETLVIANTYNYRDYKRRGLLLELFDFIVNAQNKVGYLNLGFEFVGEREVLLIKNFGFKELEHLPGGWTISVAALKEQIHVGSTCC